MNKLENKTFAMIFQNSNVESGKISKLKSRLTNPRHFYTTGRVNGLVTPKPVVFVIPFLKYFSKAVVDFSRIGFMSHFEAR